ncbi:PPC domain-containing protein [Tuwongella immobilis]|uniref:Peptidase C-terminal archaeal/bacterial domain-containing protein n=1 Tax=Tuwongella immobilis TaxID=692036 RepID=A0A6C2YTN4_9BACT|nr:PPC domain-containing protein [Tuwongella immobilis]VIP04707.1 Hypothetical conserved protein OS=uncultured planctomycete GN=HGMM_F07G10C28 PE=4 SV=1: PPC [Tuwongella immobilis]VTS06773.1 Hypothetical conserved protein OS=uncultured planctomycete GN=HGMM_F07G10C28 PE=4 SV=1: PPC [Tuwongella immobilis]
MRWNLRPFVSVMALLMGVSLVSAQPAPSLPLPRLDSVSPAGAKSGTSLELTPAGTDLEEPQQLLFSHPGITAELVPVPPPADPKKPTPPPAIRNWKVTIAANVPVGIYDVRLVNAFGISNPRAFAVGTDPELAEVEPNNDVPQAQKITLPLTINGGFASPTDVDYYQFTGKKGQRILAYAATSSIDSKARPAIEIFELTGKRLTIARNYHLHDGLADVTLPADGDYLIRMAEFTYTQGGPQHFYRLTIGSGPWIDAVYPPMVEPGKPSQVTVIGRNLPGGQPVAGLQVDGRPVESLSVTITPPADPAAASRLTFSGIIEPKQYNIDGFEYRFTGPTGTSNPILVGFASTAVTLEKEPNDRREMAQAIGTTAEIAGRIDRQGDRDWYRFEAKAGQVVRLECFSDRLGMPSDLSLVITNAMGGFLREDDDTTEVVNPVQFFARTSDPNPIDFSAPADGVYYVLIRSQADSFQYGPRFGYRLKVSAPSVDFRLVVMPQDDRNPSSLRLRPDNLDGYDVFVIRSGNVGPIALSMDGLPAGVSLLPQVVPATAKQTQLVLSVAPGTAPATAFPILKGTATIDGKPIVREARPASVTWGVPAGQNIPTLARLDRALVLAVRDQPFLKVTPSQTALTLKQGEKANLTVAVARQRPELKVPVIITTLLPDPNVTFNNNQPLTVAPDKNDGPAVLEVKAPTAPGKYLLHLRGSATFPFAKDPKAAQKPNITASVALPTIAVNVVPTIALKLPAPTVPGNLKIGEMATLTVKIERQFAYAGDVKLKLTFPMGTTGLTADEVTIPAGQNEANVIVKTTKDTPAGPRNNVVLTATANWDGSIPLSHEVKFNLNVVK